MATAKTATASTANPANDTVSAREIEENIERIRGDIASRRLLEEVRRGQDG